MMMVGDCRIRLKELPDNSVDSIVTDPPYELGFMGKSWDSSGIAYDITVWQECLRVLKPGGHLLAFGGSRTYHRLACAVEDAGFQIRDQIMYVYGSGFPKSLNVFKALKKQCTCGNMDAYERASQNTESQVRPMREPNIQETINPENQQGEVLQSGLSKQGIPASVLQLPNKVREGQSRVERRGDVKADARELSGNNLSEVPERVSANGEEGWLHHATPARNGSAPVPSTDADGSSPSCGSQPVKQPDREPCAFCKQFGTQAIRTLGVGTALKPAHEPIVLARKPLDGTVANNTLVWGVGGLNIDGCRVAFAGDVDKSKSQNNWKPQGYESKNNIYELGVTVIATEQNTAGRFPANFIHDGSDEVLELFPDTKPSRIGNPRGTFKKGLFANSTFNKVGMEHEDSGSAARFFYCAKANKTDRNEGLNLCGCDKLSVWENADQKANHQQGTDHSAKRAISESGTPSNNDTEWNTMLSGNNTTESSRGICESTTLMKTNLTTTFPTSPRLTPSPTNESTQDANSEMVNGGNLAKSVKTSNQSDTPTGISAKKDGCSTGDADPATSPSSSNQNKSGVTQCANCGGIRRGHPTVKPTTLMRYLCRLITPPNGTILDPFTGSGSTGKAAVLEGFNFIGIELSQEYADIATTRISHAQPRR